MLHAFIISGIEKVINSMERALRVLEHLLTQSNKTIKRALVREFHKKYQLQKNFGNGKV